MQGQGAVLAQAVDIGMRVRLEPPALPRTGAACRAERFRRAQGRCLALRGPFEHVEQHRARVTRVGGAGGGPLWLTLRMRCSLALQLQEPPGAQERWTSDLRGRACLLTAG